MHRNDPLPDWSLVRVFLAVAETGSYSGAARQIGSSQPTVGRQIEALESTLGTPLFQRHPGGMRLTEAGAALIEPARDMRKAARSLALSAAGASETLSGTVRITASVIMAHYLLPPIVSRIRDTLPEVAVEIAASDRAENLLFREADLAVRMFRPNQLDIVTRHIGDTPMGFYAATRYLDAKGRPEGPEDFMRHRFVGFDRDDRIVRGFRERGLGVTRDFFGTRCDNQTVNWELVRAGCGIGVGQIVIGDRDRGLERILPDFDLPSLPVWLTAHEAMRRTPRIRRVWEILEDGLGALLS